MATFVLVHGAFHGAWCWVKVVPALVSRGHRAVAFDLPGQGDVRTPIAACSLDGNARRIAEVVAGAGEAVVLVGHSLGGISIAAAAELAPEWLARLVFLTAFLPRDGDSIASLYGPEAIRRPSGPSDYQRSADGLSYWPKPEAVVRLCYNGTPEAEIAYALPRLRPQPFAVQKAAVRLSAERYGRVPRAYVECLDDNAVSLDLQRDMVAKSPCEPVVSLPTDHSPFFSAPALLAETLAALV